MNTPATTARRRHSSSQRRSYTSKYAPPAKQNQIRVLIADHQAVVRLGLRHMLEREAGIEVVGEACSGAEALQQATRLNPDVLIGEAMLPDRSGIEILSQLAESGCTTRVLVLSAYEDGDHVEALLEAGAAGYLTKDDTPAHLVEAVRGAARGRDGWLSPSIAQLLFERQRRAASLARYQFTGREWEVLMALGQGLDNQELANALCVTTGTVKNHLTSVYEKLGVDTRARAIVWAHRQGVVI